MYNVHTIFEEMTVRIATALGFPVYFFSGPRKELVAHLSNLDAGTTTKGKKYPLIWLVPPYTEEVNDRHDEEADLPDLAIYICTYTKVNSSTKQRIADNFIPILYPIYERLIYEIENSWLVSWEGLFVPHQRVKWPFWGEPEGKQDVTPLNDTVDALLIKNLKLILNEEPCDQFKLIG